MQTCRFISIMILFGLFHLPAGAKVCSQVGHWYWPYETDARSFSGGIGNHESVAVRYYMAAGSGDFVLEAKRSGFASTTTITHYASGLITEASTGSLSSHRKLQADDVGYDAALLRLRDLVGYAGAPELYLRPYADASAIHPEATHLVTYLDWLLAARNQLQSNCILYRANHDGQGERCELTAGPVPSLGVWSGQLESVWLRDGYMLTLIANPNFDKGGDMVTLHSYDFDENNAVAKDGGWLVRLDDTTARAASSALCVTLSP